MGKARAVNVRDVAAEAGVSRTTVSLALRHSPRIPLATRERVEAVARRLGYRAHPYVAALMQQIRSRGAPTAQGVLAIVSLDSDPRSWRMRPEVPGCARYFCGMTARASERGYTLVEFSARALSWSRLREVLRARGIRGVILVPPVHEEEPVGPAPVWDDMWTVAVGTSLPAPGVHRACSDLADGARMTCETLWARGYGRIGLYMPEWVERRLEYQWSGGAIAAHDRRGMGWQVPPLRIQASAEQFARWVRKHRVDAVIGVGLEPLQFLRRINARLPEQIACALLDLSPAPGFEDCAGIDQKPEQIGASAVDLAIEGLNRNETGPPETAHVVLTRGVWVEGLTVRKA